MLLCTALLLLFLLVELLANVSRQNQGSFNISSRSGVDNPTVIFSPERSARWVAISITDLSSISIL